LGKGLEKIAGVDGLRNSSLGASDGSANALVVEAALIPEALHSPIRASPRLAGVTAEHTLVRAEHLVQCRNLECNRGNNLTDSYYFFSLSNAVDNLQALGLGVDNNDRSSFELYVQNLIEEDFVSKKPLSDWGSGEMEFSDRESVDSENCDRKALEFLCGDLMEEIFDDDSYHLSCDFKTVKRKPGANTSRKRASRKLKVRVNKISAK
jgi:hypothetical protein